MIKILFFIENLSGGGAEKVLCNLVNEMDRSRFDITVQTLWKADAAQYLRPGIRYRYCYADKTKICNFRRRLEAAADLTYRLYIKDDYDIEVAYLEFGATKILASSTNKKACKLAWVHCDLQHAIKDIDAFVRQSAPKYAKYDQVVCVSRVAKDSFDTIFQNRFPSRVLYNVVNEETVRRLADVELPGVQKNGKRVLLAVGTLYSAKNYPRMLRAFRSARELDERLALWILGDGEQRSELENYAKELGVEKYVHFWGYQQNPYPFFRMADMLLCSSNYEGFSTVITEGLILGKTILTTDCSGMRELLGDSEFGLITENEDNAFEEGLCRLVRSDMLCKQYAEKASVRGARFSARQTVGSTERFFEEVYEITEHKL